MHTKSILAISIVGVLVINTALQLYTIIDHQDTVRHPTTTTVNVSRRLAERQAYVYTRDGDGRILRTPIESLHACAQAIHASSTTQWCGNGVYQRLEKGRWREYY